MAVAEELPETEALGEDVARAEAVELPLRELQALNDFTAV
jgi:hypothetical protein